MKVDDFIKRLRELPNKIIQNNIQISVIAANEAMAEMLDRIFVKGLAADGTKIGDYSNDPIYVSVPYPQLRNAGLRKKGRQGKKTKRSAFFSKGYKEFRQQAGRQSGFVDLNLTGSLFNSVKVGKYQGKVVIFFDQDESIVKAQGNEKRFGKEIFTLSREGIKIVNEAIARELNLLIKQIFI